MDQKNLIRRPRVAARQLADEVYDRLTEEFIFSGKVPPGELLPSETQLSSYYGVSRVTLRSALRRLQDAHLIRIRNGLGSVVLPRPTVVAEGLDQLVSLETYARERSQEVGTMDVEWSEEPAGEEAAMKLGVAVGSALHVVQRVKVLGETRVAWGIEYMPADLLSFDVAQSEYAGSLMDVLLAHPEFEIEYADAELMPAAAPAAVARRLAVKPGTVCQVLEQVMYGSGRPVQWGRAYLLPEHYRLQVRRRPSPVRAAGP